MPKRNWKTDSVRVLLLLLALEPLANQIPALVATRAFYDRLPGRVSAAPADDWHLLFLRDMSAGRIALSVLLLAAAVRMRPQVVRIALVTVFVASVLRFGNHLFSETGDSWINWVGFSAAVVLPLMMLVLLRGQASPLVDATQGRKM